MPHPVKTKLHLPVDEATIEKLRTLGSELVRDPLKRTAYMADAEKVLAEHGLDHVNMSNLDHRVVNLLADPKFHQAIETKNMADIRHFIQQQVGPINPGDPADKAGIFDADFDVEVEVEVVAVAVATFVFAGAKAAGVTPEEIAARRDIVANAFKMLNATRGATH